MPALQQHIAIHGGDVPDHVTVNQCHPMSEEKILPVA
jgi:hypothetical protein